MVSQNNAPLYIITIALILILGVILIIVFLGGTTRCISDSDCGTGSCFRGSCIDLAPVNSNTRKCVSNSQCNFGELCLNNVCLVKPCQSLSECSGGTFCDNNVCTIGRVNCLSDTDTTPGCQAQDPCTSSIECGNGMLCFQGGCQLPGVNGQPCQTTSDCRTGTCTNFECFSLFETCTDNSDCTNTQRCSLGVCVPRKDLTETCTQNQDCISDICSNQGICVAFAPALGESCVSAACQIGLDCDSEGICQTGPIPQLGQACVDLDNCTFGNYCGLNSVCVAKTDPIYGSPGLKYDFYFGVADGIVPVSFDSQDLAYYTQTTITVNIDPDSGDDIITDYNIKFSFTDQLPELRKITKYTGSRLDDFKIFQLYILDTETPINVFNIYSGVVMRDLYYYTQYYFGTTPVYRYTIPQDIAVTNNFHSPGHQFLSDQSTYTLPGNIILEGELIGFSIN